MGLDMYLNRVMKVDGLSTSDLCEVDAYVMYDLSRRYYNKTHDTEFPYTFSDWEDNEYTQDDLCRIYRNTADYVLAGGSFNDEGIFEKVGYWRKANALHNWMVENVQGGCDDCEVYEVPRWKLEELLDICKEVLSKAVVEEGKIRNGATWNNGGWITNYEDGQVIVNKDEIGRLLPTCPGFFFGSTDYDEYYLEDVKDTISIIENVLNTTDFKDEIITYRSSW